MRVLGVPVGTTEYKARFCHQVVKALAADLATLRRVPSLQAQHVILTKSLMHRVTTCCGQSLETRWHSRMPPSSTIPS